MSDDQDSFSIRKIREKIDDYTTTIHALQAFVSVTTWDDQLRSKIEGAKSSFGRRMDTSASNRISPNNTITPDAVIQRTVSIGYVVEAKKSLPLNIEHWDSVVEQIEKYDDDLSGWWNENGIIEVSCVVLLIEMARSVAFANYLNEKIDSGEVILTRPVSIIEFLKSTEVDEYLFIRKQWGVIQNDSVSSKLDNGTMVPIEKVVGTYGQKRFYDAEPIVEHTMVILWQDIFNDLKSEIPFDEEAGSWVFSVSLNELTDELRKLYGSSGDAAREVAFPRRSWIRDAMEAFSILGYAQRATQDDDDDYLVFFRRIKGDVLERFAEHRKTAGRESSLTAAEQIPLFPQEDE